MRCWFISYSHFPTGNNLFLCRFSILRRQSRAWKWILFLSSLLWPTSVSRAWLWWWWWGWAVSLHRPEKNPWGLPNIWNIGSIPGSSNKRRVPFKQTNKQANKRMNHYGHLKTVSDRNKRKSLVSSFPIHSACHQCRNSCFPGFLSTTYMPWLRDDHRAQARDSCRFREEGSLRGHRGLHSCPFHLGKCHQLANRCMTVPVALGAGIRGLLSLALSLAVLHQCQEQECSSDARKWAQELR